MLTLTLLVLAQYPQHWLSRQPNLPTSSLAAFSAFDTSGAGTSGPCSTTAPTDARGGAGTYVRATAETCTKGVDGLRTTLIATGDLVPLSSGQPSVMLDQNGVLGLGVFSARTNSELRTQEIENAAWVVDNSAGRIPTFWVNDGGAPDGTQTAEAMHSWDTTSAAMFSDVFQSFSVASGSGIACSGYAMSATPMDGGVPVASTTDICLNDGAAWMCTPCAYVPTTHSRCSLVVATGTGTARSCKFGNNTNQNGGTTRTSNDVFVWGLSGEAGTTMGPYIATTSATVTRNADVASFAVTLSGANFSAAASYQTPTTLITSATAFQVYVDANNSVTASVSAGAKLVCDFKIGGVTSSVTSSASVTANAVNRTACTYGASGRSACVGGVCTTTAGALTMFTGAATFYAGTRSATGNEANGIVSRLCYDPSDPRCVL